VRKAVLLLATIAAAGALLAGTVLAVAPQAHRIATATSSIPEEIDLAALDDFAVRSQVFAADGTVLAALHGPENREPVPIERVPRPVIDAILAVEDADFYHHRGVNFRSMARALFENVSAGAVEQGGSTITQQLVKNAMLTSDRDLDRKTKEIAYALRLERQLGKDEILEKYLNTVYFGAGAYGVQAAAETYWGVDVEQLGWPEAAMLAALIRNPVAYDPTLHPEQAYERRKLALERLVAEGRLTAEQADEYDSAPLPVRRCGNDVTKRPLSCGDAALPPPEDYFVEAVKQELLDDPRLGATREERINAVFSGGLRIHTTLSPYAQFAAELAQATVIPANDKGITAALVAVDSHTGAVRALVGGPGFEAFKYDIATHPPGRQTGSAFKTFVLLTALEQGNLPFDTIYGGGSFANPGGTPDPYVISGAGGTLTSVTTASSNGAFVRLGQVVGLDKVVDLARRLGITGPLDPEVISMPLGTFETTPIEMASAYSSIPNGGVHEPYYLVERVEDRNGRVLFEHERSGRRVFSEKTACYATQILRQNVLSGTGTRARLPAQDAAGKTGTTEDHGDAWFVGFTPFLTTAVWMGNPDQRVPMQNLGGIANFGGTYPAMIWQRFNQTVHQGLPAVPFPDCPAPDRFPRNVLGQGNIFLNGGFRSPSRPPASRSPNPFTPSEEDRITIEQPSNPPPVDVPPPAPVPEPAPPGTTSSTRSPGSGGGGNRR
jgi:penicillin-binding protein 1A